MKKTRIRTRTRFVTRDRIFFDPSNGMKKRFPFGLLYQEFNDRDCEGRDEKLVGVISPFGWRVGKDPDGSLVDFLGEERVLSDRKGRPLGLSDLPDCITCRCWADYDVARLMEENRDKERKIFDLEMKNMAFAEALKKKGVDIEKVLINLEKRMQRR